MEKMSIEAYLLDLASKKPTPGGGGASALTGAIGMALAGMVTSLTTGKKKYAEYETEILRLQQESMRLQKELTELQNEDARAFAPLARAYGLPKGTEEEKKARAQVMEEALLKASLVPLAIMKQATEGLLVCEELLQKGSTMAVSDTGTAAACLRAAINGAALNVYINTKSMKNRETAADLNRQAEALREEGTKRADALYRQVWERLVKEPS
jgi:formiminotetrahydrofolate cyclodeaminase